MYNSNTNTLSEKYNSSSLFGDTPCNTRISKTKSSRSEEIENPYFDLTKYYSIELKRYEVSELLEGYFDFESYNDIIDYLADNVQICKILNGLAKYIRNSFDINSKLILELMNEDGNWKTLFININTHMNWEESNLFYDKLLDTLLYIDPKLVNIINFNFNPR
jgi:hypothetical protein